MDGFGYLYKVGISILALLEKVILESGEEELLSVLLLLSQSDSLDVHKEESQKDILREQYQRRDTSQYISIDGAQRC